MNESESIIKTNDSDEFTISDETLKNTFRQGYIQPQNEINHKQNDNSDISTSSIENIKLLNQNIFQLEDSTSNDFNHNNHTNNKNITLKKNDSSNRNFENKVLYNIDYQKIPELKKLINENTEKIVSMSNDDMNILQRACFLNKYGSVKCILKELQKIYKNEENKFFNFLNYKNYRGYTALHYSIICGNTDIYKFLLDANVDDSIITNEGYNNLILACQTKRSFIFLNELEKLSQKNNNDIYSIILNCKDKNNCTLLHWSAFNDYVFGVQFLLSIDENNELINLKDSKGLTALQYALMNNSNKCLQDLILKKNSNILNKDNDERNAYDYAEAMDNEKFFEILNLINIKIIIFYRCFYIITFLIIDLIIYVCLMPYINSLFIFILFLLFNGLLLIFVILFKYIGSGLKKGEKNLFSSLIKIYNSSSYNNINDIKNYCPYCYVKKDKNIYHCNLCNQCFENQFRHNTFFGKCIIKKNYLLFILVNITYLVCLIFFIIIAIIGCIVNEEIKEDNINFPFFKLGIEFLYKIETKKWFSIFIMVYGSIMFFISLLGLFRDINKFRKLNLKNSDGSNAKGENKEKLI